MKRINVASGGVYFALLIVLTSASPSVALDRRVKIVNETGYTIREFYASSVGANTWQEDILGDETLSSGYSIVINVDDGTGYCKYDFKAVFDDGDVVEEDDVNVCEVATFTFN